MSTTTTTFITAERNERIRQFVRDLWFFWRREVYLADVL